MNHKSATVEEPLIPEKVLRFMNALPVTFDTVEWLYKFREELRLLLGEVDRISCSINVICDLEIPERYRPNLEVFLNTRREGPTTTNSIPTIQLQSRRARSLDMLDEYRRLGYPVEQYHAPICYDYYLHGKAYLASVLLFRERFRGPISDRIPQTMKALEPFLIFAFSSLVARHNYKQPIDRLFTQALNDVGVSESLTKRELQVIALHLMGLSYSQIAGQLFISEHTVAKHVKSAHRKTGCASFLELFAPYFRTAAGEETPG
jgi:DNA-binding CsgD family transcriptional regulator